MEQIAKIMGATRERNSLAGNGTDFRGKSIDEIEQEIVEVSNRQPGHLTGYDCPKCMNRGYFWAYQDGQRFIRDCECAPVRESIKELRRIGLREVMDKYTFEAFQCREQWQAAVKSDVLQFVNDENRQWLLLAGQPGAGKTHLGTAAAVRFLKAGIPVRYMLWIEDGTRLKAVINDAAAYARLINPLKTCKVLYIDDLFKRKNDQRDNRQTDMVDRGDIRLAFDIINYRYINHLTTIISTERMPEDLFLIDEGTGSRIHERTKAHQVVIRYDRSKNWRISRHGT